MLAVSALAIASVGLAACSTVNPSASVSCAWGLKASKDSFNVAYPDATATYFGTKYTLGTGQKLVLSGTFPFARYMSLHTYGLSGTDYDHIADQAVTPDAGSDNPFSTVVASGDPAHRKWTVTIDPAAPAIDGAAGNNTIGTPAVGTVFMRVYVPDNPLDQAGGVPLPDMKVVDASGATTWAPSTCTVQQPDGGLIDLVNAFGPPTDVPPSDPPVFKRPATVAGIYPNRDNAYLASIAAYQPGKVIVVRGKAPTSPDTQMGQSPATPSQLRYWSFCTNEYRKPYPVSFCAVDHEAPIDGSGYYTIVVSTPAEQPTNATLANGITWVDWGSTSTNLLMAFRHMLPALTFPETVKNLAPGQLASDIMGVYTPVAVTCPIATFEAGGATACGL